MEMVIIIILGIIIIMAYGGIPNWLAEDIALFNNKKVVDDLIPRVLTRIINWGCSKGRHEKFWDFLAKRHERNWSECRKRYKSHKEKLQHTTCEYFDTALLLKLLPDICDKIDPLGTVPLNDDSRVESLFQDIAWKIRNPVIHNRGQEAISSTVPSTAEEILVKLLNAAGQLYGKTKAEVRKEVDNVETMVRDVQKTFVNPRQRTIIDLQYKLKKDCKYEIREVWERVFSKEVLPFCRIEVDRSDVFHCITLEILYESVEKRVKFSCEKLFQKSSGFKNAVNCIVIEGVSGSGKSTLVQLIALDYVRDGKVFSGIEQYSMMIHMECRNPNIGTLPEVLNRNFPKTLQHFGMDEVISAVQNMRVLFFIDGIDELNPENRKLVNDVLDYFGTKEDSMLIFTSRPNLTKVITDKLLEKSIRYQALSIKQISQESEQVEFLERYQAAIPGINCKELIEAFRSLKTLKNELQSHFVYPLILTLFYHLFRESPADVNVWTSHKNVMEQTTKLCRDKMVQRIIAANPKVVNTQPLVSKIIDAVCDLSFKCLCLGEMSIDQPRFDDFCNNCIDNIDSSIDYYSIMSCILLTRCSYYSAEGDSYCFFHKSQQEHLASKSITTRIRKRPRSSVREALDDIMGDPFAPENLEKIVMALKFALLEYDTPNKKSRLGEKRYDELLELLKTAGRSSFEDWTEIVCNFPDCKKVEKVAAVATGVEDIPINTIWWEVTNAGQVSAATRMLRHNRPSGIKVILRKSWVHQQSDLIALLEAVAKFPTVSLVLELHCHFDTYTPADDVVLQLEKYPYGLISFRGCLSTVEAATSLAVVTGIALSPGLEISLPRPYEHPLMELELQETRHALHVTVRHCKDDRTNGNQTPAPLPRGAKPPQLTIADTPLDGVAEAEALFLCLAPGDKRYSRLQLRNCQLLDKDLWRLVRTLYKAGLRTDVYSDGGTRPEDAGTLSGECQVCLDETNSLHDSQSRCISLHITGDAPEDEPVEGADGAGDEGGAGEGGPDPDGEGREECKKNATMKSGISAKETGTSTNKAGASKKRPRKRVKKKAKTSTGKTGTAAVGGGCSEESPANSSGNTGASTIVVGTSTETAGTSAVNSNTPTESIDISTSKAGISGGTFISSSVTASGNSYLQGSNDGSIVRDDFEDDLEGSVS